MDMIIKFILSAVIGYLCGSISFAVVFSKMALKKDVREFGSGNAGATNIARMAGLKVGIMTFLADFLKTCIAMVLGRLIGGYDGMLLAGAMCLVGHCWPVFFGFRGGKGVSVGAALGFMLDWRMLILLVAVFAIGAFGTKRVSCGSIACGIAFPIIQYCLGIRDLHSMIFGFFAMIIVVSMHHQNIKRLINGTEQPFKAGKSKENDKNSRH